MSKQSMPCPVCQNNIEFDVAVLLKGASLSCPKCNTLIKLSDEGNESVSKAIEALRKIKDGT